MRKEFIETDQLASPLTERERPGDHEPAVATKAIDESVSEEEAARQRTIGRLRLLWDERRTLGRAAFIGLIVGAVIAILIPNRYVSTARLTPPDQGELLRWSRLSSAKRGTAFPG